MKARVVLRQAWQSSCTNARPSRWASTWTDAPGTDPSQTAQTRPSRPAGTWSSGSIRAECTARWSALRAAVDSLAVLVLEDHVQGCVRTAAEQGDAERYVDEVVDVVRRTLGRPLRGSTRSS